MRILLSTRGSSGHFLPLVPFARACERAGHEVLVTAQRGHAGNVERTGLPFAPVADPEPRDWMPLMEEFGRLSFEEANRVMAERFFGGLDTRAAMDDLDAIVADYAPDVILRESWEFASGLVAERRGVPIARVGLGLATVEDEILGYVAPPIDTLRRELGMDPDPAGERMRELPFLTVMPEPLDDVALAPPATHRFGEGPPAEVGELPDWWNGSDDPLLYVSLGSVTGGRHLPYFPGLYREILDELDGLPVRVLITLGNDRAADELGSVPSNVHVEPWVDQAQVLPHAAAMLGHGGYGSTLGALRHGVPLVVLPLFSLDQWANGAAVADAGACVCLDAERSTRTVMGVPGRPTLAGVRSAVGRVLRDGAFRLRAERIARVMAEAPPIDDAVSVLEALRTTTTPGLPGVGRRVVGTRSQLRTA